MDFDGLDGAVAVWVARVDVTGEEEMIVAAWSMLSKAKAWVEHERVVETDLTWRENRGSGPGIRVGAHDESGVEVASIHQVEIMDPIELSRQHPLRMPAARTSRYDGGEM